MDGYQVVCSFCGVVWSPAKYSTLWWKAYNRAKKGFVDAYRTTAEECGCQVAEPKSDKRYHVFGYTDMCEDFDFRSDSLVAAARRYLTLARDGMNVVFFQDTTQPNGHRSKVESRLIEMTR